MRIVSHWSGPIPSLQPAAHAWNPALEAALVRVPGDAALRQRLRAPGALVVTTGQQPGMFTGPVYTVHKSMAAAALARRLEAEWNRPVVPLLWVGGDDHDFAEASTACWLDRDGQVAEWHLPPRPDDAPQLPMYRELLPDTIADGLAILTSTLPPGELLDATIAWLSAHYRAGVSLHDAAAGALAELLLPEGILVLSAPAPAMKRAQAPLIARALQDARRLDATLGALPEVPGGVVVGDGATLVMLETAIGRDRLVLDGEAFRTRRSGERFSLQELEALLHETPERFSPNVLLRPVVEAALLPTVAYVAGPGELRYIERQAAALYPLLDVARQPAVPRWSGTLVEAWADRLLGRLGVSLEEVLGDADGALGRSILRRDLPPAVTGAIAGLQAEIDDVEAVLRAEGTALDPVLDRAVEGRARKLRGVAEDLERLFERHLRRRDDIAHAQYRRLRTALRPGDVPQERRFGAPSFLSRHGERWLPAIREAVDQWAATA